MTNKHKGNCSITSWVIISTGSIIPPQWTNCWDISQHLYIMSLLNMQKIIPWLLQIIYNVEHSGRRLVNKAAASKKRKWWINEVSQIIKNIWFRLDVYATHEYATYIALDTGVFLAQRKIVEFEKQRQCGFQRRVYHHKKRNAIFLAKLGMQHPIKIRR